MKITICISFFLGFIGSYHLASAATIQCPQTIQTNQSLQHDISKWHGFLDNLNSNNHFERITFYSGHPKEHASLAPDSESSKIKKLTWTFGEQETWIACEYTHTQIQLIQKIPAGTKSCTVTYNANYFKVVAINCI
ncbi:STY0301 family protein [Legionella sp. WA2022007384]